jgi:hypothetical protein
MSRVVAEGKEGLDVEARDALFASATPSIDGSSIRRNTVMVADEPPSTSCAAAMNGLV